MDSDSDDNINVRKRKRGPYKRYFLNPEPGACIDISRSTLASRERAAAANQGENQIDGNDAVAHDVQGHVVPFHIPEVPIHDPALDPPVELDNVVDELVQAELDYGGPDYDPAVDPPVELDNAVDELVQAELDLGEPEYGSDYASDESSNHSEIIVENNQQDGEDVHAEARRAPIDYVEKYRLNDKVHHDSSLSKLDVLLMILHLSIRHANTQHFVEDQIKFVNILFDSEVLDISYYSFQNIFPSAKSIERHYYCDVCEIYLGSQEDFPKEILYSKCPKCEKDIDVQSVDSKNYFVTLSLKEQIQNLLKRPDIKLVNRAERDPNVISDIFDGEICKQCSQPGYPFSDNSILTVTFNTDGVQIHKSVTKSLYPFLFHLNDIIAEDRFKRENAMLGGLWFGDSAPNMALFLKPFINQLVDLSINGLSVPQADGGEIKYKVFAVCCSADSVAKPKIVCQRQFIGGFSCLYCYHPNDTVIDNENNNHQKYFDTSVTYQNRKEEEVIQDMCDADQLQRSDQLRNSSVRGFLGISILLMFMKLKTVYKCNPFHIVWSVVIDYMHALLEGVGSQLLHIYMNILTPAQLETVNRRLAQIRLPQGMSRKPRPVSIKVKYKAKELRSFFLYFAIACFEDLLPPRNFANLKLFVNSLHILLSDRISPRALHEAQVDLKNFVRGFQRLYDLKNVTYNLHLCLHLVDLVQYVGPLWCYSNFIFESCNGLLSKLVRGTRTVVNEIAVKFTRLQSAIQCLHNQPISGKAMKFCNEVVGCKFKKGEKFDDVSVTGAYSYIEVSDVDKNLFEEFNVPVINNRVQVFNRVVRKGIIYCSQSYSKARTTNDSCVLLTNNTYIMIDSIVLNSNDSLVCVARPIRLAEGNYMIVPSIKKCAFDVFGDPTIVYFTDILRKSVFLSFDSKHFVCDMPNLFERD